MLAGEKMEDFEVRSLGYSKLLCLPARDFEALLSRDPVLRESIELVARQRMRALEVWRNQPVTQPAGQTGQKDSPVAGTTV